MKARPGLGPERRQVWGWVRAQDWDPKVARFKVGQDMEMCERLRVRG